MATDRYGEALGLWHIDTNGADFDLRLQLGDGRKLRNLLMDDNIRNNKITLFEKFNDFMYDIIKRDYPEDEEEDIKKFIEFNLLKLFEESQIAFRYTTREELDKAKEETTKDLKKLIDGN